MCIYSSTYLSLTISSGRLQIPHAHFHRINLLHGPIQIAVSFHTSKKCQSPSFSKNSCGCQVTFVFRSICTHFHFSHYSLRTFLFDTCSVLAQKFLQFFGRLDHGTPGMRGHPAVPCTYYGEISPQHYAGELQTILRIL
jgi:hypothetical protein